MGNVKRLIATLSVAALAAFVVGQGQVRVEPVSEICLGCLCEAISNCNRSLTCTGDVCGIFRITWAYWADAGKPVLNLDDPAADGAYARCVNDPVCAARTVTGYMTRFAQDCNGDRVVNCFDYAKIHKLGGYGCGGQLPQDFSYKFNSCFQSVQSQGIGQADNFEII